MTTIIESSRRESLPAERQAITHKFKIRSEASIEAGDDGSAATTFFVTAGLYPDGRVGELFICVDKEGSAISGMMDSFAAAISIGLQHGVPLKALARRFRYARFEPSGVVVVDGKPIGLARSPVDYIFDWLTRRFGVETVE